MKRFYSKFRIGLITFALGLASVWLFGFKEESKSFSPSNVSVSDSKYENVKIPVTSTKSIGKHFGTREFTDEKECIKIIKRRCENGYREIYSLLKADGTALKEYENKIISGFYYVDPQEFELDIAGNEIIERIENFKNDFIKGTRIILKNRNGKNGKEFYEILLYDGKESLYYISAPNLEIALEFEEWQNEFNSQK